MPLPAHCAILRSNQVQRRAQWLARATQAGVALAAMEFAAHHLRDLGANGLELPDATPE